MLSFYYNGIKENGILFKGRWTKGNYTAQSGISEDSITFYESRCNRATAGAEMKAAFKIKNESDAMTDYFEYDSIVISPENKYYAQCFQAWEKQEAREAARMAKRA